MEGRFYTRRNKKEVRSSPYEIGGSPRSAGRDEYSGRWESAPAREVSASASQDQRHTQGDAWQAIEGQEWKITRQAPYKFEFSCKQKQQLSIDDAKAFLRERIEANLQAKIQNALDEYIADENTPGIHKDLLCKARGVMRNADNRGNTCYDRDNVMVRLYQLDQDKVKLYCVQQQNTGDLYVVALTADGTSAYGISDNGISQTQRHNCTHWDPVKESIFRSGIQDSSLVPTKKIHIAAAYNFSRTAQANKQINILIDEMKNMIYITDKLKKLSEELGYGEQYFRNKKQKKEENWGSYTVTGFSDEYAIQ